MNQHPSPEFRYRGIVVECPGCGLYRVTEHALPKFRTLQLQDRFAALKKARTLAAPAPRTDDQQRLRARQHRFRYDRASTK